MKNALVILIAANALMFSSVVSFAQGGPPSRPDEPRFGLGLGIISSPRPYVDADNELMVIPVIEASYKRFYFQGIRGGFRLVENPKISFDLTIRWSFTRLDPDDSPFLTGMEERDSTAMAGFGFDWNIAREWQLSVKAATDVLGRHGGVEAETMVTWRKRIGTKFVLAPSAGVIWQSADLVDHYVGVRPEEDLPWRPAYEGADAFNFSGSVTGLYFFSPKIHGVGTLMFQTLDNEIRDSPVVDDSWGYFALLGLVYQF